MCLAISASVASPSLLHYAEQLYCASDPDSARTLIEDIRQVELFTPDLPPGLPNESDDPYNPNLQAVTLDRLLSALYHTSVIHPSTRNLVEDTVTAWNYCSVVDNGSVFDHITRSGKITRTRTSDPVNQWQGFKAFGLIDHEGEIFNFSTAFKSSVHDLLAGKQHQGKYINQCLPHRTMNIFIVLSVKTLLPACLRVVLSVKGKIYRGHQNALPLQKKAEELLISRN